MRIHLKIALAVLSLAVALPAAYAQVSEPAQAQQQTQQARPARPSQWQGPMRGGRGWAFGRRSWGPGRGMRMGMRAGRRAGAELMLMRLVNNPEMRQRLAITTEQAAKIRQQTSDFLKEQIRSRASIQVQHVNLRNLLAAEKPDRAAIDSALEQISSLQLAQAKAVVSFRLAMRDALTPEQRQKLMQLRGEFMRRGRGMPGPRGPRGMNRPGPGPSPSPNPPSEN